MDIRKLMLLLAFVGGQGLAALPLAVAGEMNRADYERLVTSVGDIPPVIRTTGLENYSSNRLDFALMNGLAMTRGGRIYLNWISGGDGAESFTAGNWSDDGGKTWTDVNLVIDGHDGSSNDRTNIIGTYWLDPDGNLRLYTDQSLFHFDRRAGVWESVCRNPDAANPVWSEPRRVCDGHLLNKPIVLRNGEWAFSAYLNNCGAFGTGAPTVKDAFGELDPLRGSTCYVSADRGKTWTRRGSVRFPGEDWQETQLLELKDGTLRVFCRVFSPLKEGEKGVGHLMASESRDGGRTWCEPHALKGMDNVNARFQVVRLASGRLLFVCHGRPEEGGKDGVGRIRLSAYLSDDDGETWKGGLVLDPTYGSYPDVFQAPDGTICVAHDHGRNWEAEIRFHRFTEEDVLAGRIVSAGSRLGVVAFQAVASTSRRRRVDLAKDGKSDYSIVIAKDAPKPDRYAAEELRLHLEKATGATFPILGNEVKDEGEGEQRKVFLLRRVGKDEGFESEECRVRTDGATIVIEGEGDRGVAYGVYAFLERKLGVRWFTPQDESLVPEHKTLVLWPFSFSERPKLRERGILNLEDHVRNRVSNGTRFMHRNRFNVSERNFVSMDGAVVPAEYMHHPLQHQPFFFVPPFPQKEIVNHGVRSLVVNKGYLKDHPDWYALRSENDPTHVCFSNPGFRAELEKNFIAFVEETAKREGPTAYEGYWSIGTEDQPGRCWCKRCDELAKREEAEGAAYFDFQCWFAPRMRARYPKMKFQVSCYGTESTQICPKTLRLPENCTVTWAPVRSDRSKTYDAPSNALEAKTLRDWCARSPLVDRDYTFSWGVGAPPAGSFDHVVSGIRMTYELGGIGMTLENAPGHDNGRGLSDLALWVYAQLARDPTQDWRVLAREFCDFYYGAAAEKMMDYVNELERLTAASPTYLRGRDRDLNVLTPENIYGWMRRFDEMVEEVERSGEVGVKSSSGREEFARPFSNSNSKLQLFLIRLNEARAPVDSEALLAYKEIKRLHPEWIETPKSIFDRALASLNLSSTRRYGPKAKPYQFIDNLKGAYFDAASEVKPLPEMFAKIEPSRIVQVIPKMGRGDAMDRKTMDDAAAGAVVYPNRYAQKAHKAKIEQMPFLVGVNDWVAKRILVERRIPKEEIVPDEFRFYKVGRFRMVNEKTTFFLCDSWSVNYPADGIFQPGAEFEWDLYLSIKFEGPAYSDRSKAKKSLFYLDRAVFVRVEESR